MFFLVSIFFLECDFEVDYLERKSEPLYFSYIST